MSTLKNIFRNVSVFDVDGTLIKDNIGVTLVKYLLKNKEVNIIPKLMILISYPLYKLGILDFKYAIIMGSWALSGKTVNDISRLARKCFEEEIGAKIYKDGINEIKKRKEEGDYIILATGAHFVIASLFGDFVGADFVISTTSQISNGKYTLKTNIPIPYRKGKSDMVFDHIEKMNAESIVTVYTDEEKDLPMLKRADILVGVNADLVISNFVKERGGLLISFS